MDWKNIANINDLELKLDQKGEFYKKESVPLASQMGAKKLGFHIVVLHPKTFSCPYHFHHSDEELFLILEGKAILRQAGQFREVKKGDLLFFTNSPEGAHQLYNHTDRPVKYLDLTTMDDFEVCEYPDSQKVYVSRIKKLFQAGSKVDYFKDEENPKLFWPKKFL
ncbi:MAG TPA: auxin-binding protein [Bdellovibrionales bacterium]|nr:auxin-binding protein [Bdellovibrionales bacterium]